MRDPLPVKFSMTTRARRAWSPCSLGGPNWFAVRLQAGERLGSLPSGARGRGSRFAALSSSSPRPPTGVGARLQRRLLTVERLGLRPVHSILRLSPSGAHAACPCPPEGSMGPVSRELSNCPCSVVLGGGSHGGGSENTSSDRASSRDRHDVGP